jgi:hypothetical protein
MTKLMLERVKEIIKNFAPNGSVNILRANGEPNHFHLVHLDIFHRLNLDNFIWQSCVSSQDESRIFRPPGKDLLSENQSVELGKQLEHS